MSQNFIKIADKPFKLFGDTNLAPRKYLQHSELKVGPRFVRIACIGNMDWIVVTAHNPEYYNPALEYDGYLRGNIRFRTASDQCRRYN
jgi:hypothetical protein